jgi:type VI secretion system secreted protein Hcp
MAFDAFLKIDGLPGESTDDKHKDWIEVLSYSWGVSQSASRSASTSGGASSERADFQDFSIVKAMDKASPKLALACAQGKHFKDVALELCRAGGDKLKYMEYKLEEVIVSSASVGGGGGGEPTESVTFNYGKINWTYTQQKRSDGTGGGQIAAKWDLTANKGG